MSGLRYHYSPNPGTSLRPSLPIKKQLKSQTFYKLKQIFSKWKYFQVTWVTLPGRTPRPTWPRSRSPSTRVCSPTTAGTISTSSSRSSRTQSGTSQEVSSSMVFSHWSRNVEARLSLVEECWGSAVICTQGTLCLYGIRMASIIGRPYKRELA